MSKNTILIVDDDPDLVEMNKMYLEDKGFNILIANNGKEALSVIESGTNDIDAILCDVMMPEMNGYELCETVKQNKDFLYIPFIFVSSLTSLDEIVKGYTAGGDDYLKKPTDPEETAQKISIAIEQSQLNRELAQQVKESHETVMQTMNYYGDMGQTLEFYKECISVTTLDNLTDILFKYTSNQNLKCCILYSTSDENKGFSPTGKISPLEINVLELARNEGRIFDFGARTILNYEHFSLLIKNMPTTDTEKCSIIKDSIGTICNAVEIRSESILKDNSIEKRETLICNIQTALMDIDKTFKEIQSANKNILKTMMIDLDETLLVLGLLQSQEKNIREIAQTCIEESTDIFEVADDLHDKFEEILVRLA